MIEQLTVTGFAVARDVTLAPGPGLNVITGETGAGKSIIVDALDFLFGGRHGRGVVAGGAESARVRASVRAGDDRLTVERTVRLSGRTAGRIDGESAPAERLRALGARVIDIHGQSEQLTLLRPAVQLAVLDAFGGLRDRRDALAAQVRELRALRREIEAIGADSRERERLLDQLRFEVDEIAQAGLVPGEDEALRREQRRLASVERLLAASATALEALDAPPIAEAVAAFEEIAGSDPDATALAAEGVTLEQAAADLGRSLRAYRETLEDDPERRDTIEARLDQIARLRRKYGESVEAILEYESSARERLRAMETAGSSLDELRERAEALARSAAEAAASLSLARREAAARLIAGGRGGAGPPGDARRLPRRRLRLRGRRPTASPSPSPTTRSSPPTPHPFGRRRARPPRLHRVRASTRWSCSPRSTPVPRPVPSAPSPAAARPRASCSPSRPCSGPPPSPASSSSTRSTRASAGAPAPSWARRSGVSPSATRCSA